MSDLFRDSESPVFLTVLWASLCTPLGVHTTSSGVSDLACNPQVVYRATLGFQPDCKQPSAGLILRAEIISLNFG